MQTFFIVNYIYIFYAYYIIIIDLFRFISIGFSMYNQYQLLFIILMDI